MIISKKAYTNLVDYLKEEGDLYFTWDCGNDNTIIDFNSYSDPGEELFDAFVDEYNLPNATSGFYVVGSGVITLEDNTQGEEVVTYSLDNEEVEPSDSIETVELDETNIVFSTRAFKFNVEVELTLNIDENDNILDFSREDFEVSIEPRVVPFGTTYNELDFEYVLNKAVEETLDKIADIRHIGDYLNLSYIRIELNYTKENDEEKETWTSEVICFYTEIMSISYQEEISYIEED